MLVVSLAVCLNLLLGDLWAKYQPRFLLMKLVRALEINLFVEGERKPVRDFAGGLFLVLLVGYLVYEITGRVAGALTLIANDFVRLFVESLLLALLLGLRNLRDIVASIYLLLEAKRLEEAGAVASLFAIRELEDLTPVEIISLTLITLAKRLITFVIAPLFFYLLGGLELAYLYTAVKAADLLLGYKIERYYYFGKATASIDMALNFVPARLSGICIVLAAALLGLNYQNAMRTIGDEATTTSSKTLGQAVAGYAGALGLRLGGRYRFLGVILEDSAVGRDLETMEPMHLVAAIRLTTAATLCFLLLAYLFQLALEINLFSAG